MNNKTKYYTHLEAASLLNVSESSIKLYIKELTDEEKEGKFNKKNQPNDQGVSTLLSIARERNPYLKKYDEYEKIISEKDKELEELKDRLKELEEENLALHKSYVEYAEKSTERFGKLQEQSNLIIAQLSNNNDQLQKLAAPSTDNEKDNINKKNKDGFFSSLKYFLTGK